MHSPYHQTDTIDLPINISNSNTPHIAILMGAYNGDEFISQQLLSIEHQTYKNWSLYVSDDNSQDNTIDILKETQSNWGESRLSILKGPQAGFVTNFLSLTCNTSIDADLFAWCDQDDIWLADKLENATSWFQNLDPQIPALYCSRTKLIDESGKALGYSPLFTRPPHFTNALVQNIGGGNTMVFNRAARQLLCEAGYQLEVPSHDWWAYQLISGAGGTIYYDPKPSVLYRQHNDNIIGENSSWTAKFSRLRMILGGRFQDWNRLTISALGTMYNHLDKENQESLEHFRLARKKNLLGSISSSLKSGIYRQTFVDNIILALTVIIKRI